MDVLETSFAKAKDVSTRDTLARAWYQIGRSEVALKSEAKGGAAFRRSDALYAQGGPKEPSQQDKAACGATR